MKDVKIRRIDYHRNGVCGYPFYAGIGDMIQDDGSKKEMLIIRFPKEADEKTGMVMCAALSLDQLDKREIRFFYNSFRGDYFNGAMDEVIEKEYKINYINPEPYDNVPTEEEKGK